MKELASNYQRNIDHIFASISIFDGSKKEDFYECLERFKTALLQSGNDICRKLWEEQEVVSQTV